MAIDKDKIFNTLHPEPPATPSSAPPRRRNAKKIVFYAVFLLVALKIAGLWYYYNTFLSMEYDIEESRAQIDTQLQRRKNILLNLTTMVEDYAEYEKGLFKEIAAIRAAVMGSGGVRPDDQRALAPGTDGADPAVEAAAPTGAAGLAPGDPITALASRLLAIAEGYPEVKLHENFQKFMEALVDAENTIAEERKLYNVRANDFSTAIGVFPGNLFAKLFRFKPPVFVPADVERTAPRVTY